ncbi:MAG: sensor histidine kinase, partial [Deltaproteobacteria bacterium]|nr:sensor histidine kinase [Deltaproteobacteria bacterium]
TPEFPLDGEWEFYWEDFLPPSMLDPTTRPSFAGYARLPASWGTTQIGDRRFPNSGYASYRLRLQLPPGINDITLGISQLSSAFRIFANGMLIGGHGTPGITEDTSYPAFYAENFHFHATHSDIVLVIHVSNFHHLYGGARRSFVLMEGEYSTLSMIRTIGFKNLLVGILLFVGGYHLLFYTLIRRDPILLYFGVYTLLTALREKLNPDVDLGILYPELGGIMRLRVEYLLNFILIPLFFTYENTLFMEVHSPRTKRWFLWVHRALWTIGILGGGIILLVPELWALKALDWIQYAGVLMLPLLFYLVGKGIFRKIQGSVLFFGAGIILAATFVNDILYYKEVIQTGYYIPLGLLAFVLIQAALIARRYISAFLQVERVSLHNSQLLSQLEEYSRELEEKVQERTEALVAVNTSLSEAMSTKDRLYSIIAHDLRGPVGTLNTIVALAQPGHPLEDDLVQSLKGLAGRSYELLENLLQWAVREKGKLVPRYTKTRLAEILDSTLPLMASLAGPKGITLSTDIPEGLEVIADPEMLRTIVRNLISNAIKYSHEKQTVWITARAENGGLRMEVRDEGVGLMPEEGARLFSKEVILRPLKGTKKEYGSGLGLTLCQEMIAGMGGQIGVVSQPGQGATFWFTLPAHSPATA